MKIRAAVILSLAGALAGGCGQGAGDAGRPGTGPDLLRASCDTDGVRIRTPVVVARPDGLHLELANETGATLHFGLEGASEGAAGGEATPGTSVHVLAVGPGEWTVSCYAEVAGTGGSASFELADTGIWVSTELDGCEIAQVSHGDPPRKVTEDRGELPELAREGLEALVGPEPGYEIEPAGYPEGREAVFRARSDGRTVATISFRPDEAGGWLEGEATSCPDPG